MDPDRDRLLVRWFAGERSADLIAELTAAVGDDAELRAELRDELALDRMLGQLSRPAFDAGPVLAAIAPRATADLGDRVMARIGGVERDTARRRARWFAAAAVLLATCLGAAGVAVALRPAPAPIGELATLRILGDAHWPAQLAAPPRDGARLRPGVLTLDAGRVELRFDSSARLLVEGPAEAELVSPMLVRLRRGRVTTDVPAAAHGFTVAAAGLRVVDLGTEVGIDLAADGRADVQVYAGQVEIAMDAHAPSAGSHLSAGGAVRVDPAAGAIQAIPFAPGRFARGDQSTRLDLDLADVVGGGDGRGSARFAGIDPVAGRMSSAAALGSTKGDGAFHALPGYPCIDGVFVPSATAESGTVIASTGLRQTFPLAAGTGYDLIRRGGFLIRHPDGGPAQPTREPTVIDGVDYADHGHALLGMHANAGITFDLQAIAAARGARPTRFTAVAANTAPRALAPTLCAARGAFDATGTARWSPLTVQRAGAERTTRLTVQADGSVLAADPADTDTFTVMGSVALRRISALRLEVLTDPSLPGGGPGAAPNGNFVLTSLRVAVVSAGGTRELGMTGAVADMSQAGWPVGAAVRGIGPNGWGIVPETGSAHTAVFFLEPMDLAPDAVLVVTLAHLQGLWPQHLIGHFRLSASDSLDPARELAVGAGFVTVLVDGRLMQRAVVPLSDQAPARIDVPLPPDARFLTLVSTDGGFGNGFQWTTLGDPRLELE